jgi:VTC domain
MRHNTRVRYINRFTSETKLLVDATLGDDIRAWARGRLGPDPHGGGSFRDQYGVTSLYLDTDAHDVYHRRGSYGRSKFRIRHYEKDESAFLERKLRTRLRLTKRRTRIPFEAISSLRLDDPDPTHPGYWFLRRVLLRRLRPVCVIRYSRTARMADTPEGPVRMTLDASVIAGPTSVVTLTPGQARPLVDGLMILELKYSGVFPRIFKDLVDEFHLTPRPASKYRFAVHALGLVGSGAETIKT